jgi:L-fucose mutarotase
MLKGIPAILSPALLSALGDELVIADGNFPAESISRRVVRQEGCGTCDLLDAVLCLLPLDQSKPEPVILMMTPADMPPPGIWAFYDIIIKKQEADISYLQLERFDFYERAKKAFAVAATGEETRFANIIVRKGVVIP